MKDNFVSNVKDSDDEADDTSLDLESIKNLYFKPALGIGSNFLAASITEPSKANFDLDADFQDIHFYIDPKGRVIGSFWLKSTVRERFSKSCVAFHVFSSSNKPFEIIP